YVKLIILILLVLLSFNDSFRITGTSYVNTYGSISAACEILVTDFISERCKFILSIWKEFQYGTFCAAFDIFRLPQFCRKFSTIRHFNPSMMNYFHFIREISSFCYFIIIYVKNTHCLLLLFHWKIFFQPFE